MNVKIKHIYGCTESVATRFSLQNSSVPDGDDGRVITATIFNAPSKREALEAANFCVFFPKLRSIGYSRLYKGRIIR